MPFRSSETKAIRAEIARSGVVIGTSLPWIQSFAGDLVSWSREDPCRSGRRRLIQRFLIAPRPRSQGKAEDFASFRTVKERSRTSVFPLGGLKTQILPHGGVPLRLLCFSGG